MYFTLTITANRFCIFLMGNPTGAVFQPKEGFFTCGSLLLPCDRLIEAGHEARDGLLARDGVMVTVNAHNHHLLQLQGNHTQHTGLAFEIKPHQEQLPLIRKYLRGSQHSRALHPFYSSFARQFWWPPS